MKMLNRKYRNNSIRLLVFIIFILIVSAQGKSQSVDGLTSAYIANYLDHKVDPELISQLKAKPADKVIASFEEYLTDSLNRVRSAAYRMIFKTGETSEEQQTREKAVKNLVNGLNDSEGGIVGQVVNYLQGFKPEDFNAEQRYNITMKVKQQPAPRYLKKIILLTGYLGIDELIYDYQNMLADPAKYSESEQWSMQLAMARMNDPQALKEVIGKIKRFKISDDVVFDIYPYLTYIRKKEAFDILFDAIMSNKKDCNSSNPDNEAPIICAFRIIGYTAKYVKDFPVKTDKWGTAQMGDYDATLEAVRTWIKENKDKYELIKEIY